MEEERKYQIVGEVKIGSDEYRDLIEDLAKAKSDYINERSNRWEAEQRAKKAEETAKSWKEQATLYLEFISSSEESKQQYKLFLLAKKLNDDQEG